MRFPSIDALLTRALEVLRRFPWVLATGVIAAAGAVVGVDSPAEEAWLRLTMVAVLGLPLTVALTLLAERRGWRGWARTLLIGAGVLVLGWFFAVWPGPEEKHQAIRYFQLSAGLHLLVAFLPSAGTADRGGFWQYNRVLFESILRAALFSAVLQLGLSVALLALDNLLGVDVGGLAYARLWFVIAFVVNTWIFLAGIPDDLEALEGLGGYPKGLKVFAQYILTPLVAVYLLILTAYLVKVVATGTWPSGWIGYLVSSVAVTGLLGFLLVHPLRGAEGEAWIRAYVRWLFVGLVPAALMFLLAMYKRIEPYGLTELRFLGLILGAWLLGIALLYTARQAHGIRIIPVSLAVLLLATIYGPAGATRVSVASQAHRLRGLLAAHDVPAGGAAPAGVPAEAQAEMSAAILFLFERDAVPALRETFGGSIPGGDSADTGGPGAAHLSARRVMTALGLQYGSVPSGIGPGYFTVTVRLGWQAVPVGGYDYLVEVSGRESAVAVMGQDTLTVALDTTAATLRARLRGQPVLTLDFAPLLDSLIRDGPPGPHQSLSRPLTLDATGPGLRARFLVDWFSGERRERPVLLDVRGKLLLSPVP